VLAGVLEILMVESPLVTPTATIAGSGLPASAVAAPLASSPTDWSAITTANARDHRCGNDHPRSRIITI